MQLKNTNINNISHTKVILQAAIPYVGSTSKHSVSVLLKATELMDSINTSDSSDVSACDINNNDGDLEGMLNSVKEHCNDEEKDMVDMMLNFINAQKFYQKYRSVSNLHTAGTNNNMMDMLTSMLTPEQKSTFENINLILSSMS